MDGRGDVGASRARDETSAEEVRTIVRCLSWGSLLPIVGWAYGIWLLWTSSLFTRRDKAVGTLLLPGGWFGALVAVGLVLRESIRFCWSASGGEVGSSDLVHESGCVGPTLPAEIGLPLLVLVPLAAAAGPVFVRRRARLRE